MRRVLYVAHPVAPTDDEIAQAYARAVLVGNMPTHAMLVRSACHANVARAGRWLQWLRKSFPETTFIAPWMIGILLGDDDSDPAQREAGLIDCCATIERCDGIVLCGPRISSGMQREMEAGIENGPPMGNHGDCSCDDCSARKFEAHDITFYGWKDPDDVIVEGMPHVTFEEWIGQLTLVDR